MKSTIPVTADFAEGAATYPNLTELHAHPTNGYLYGCYAVSGTVGGIVKIKRGDYTDVTTVSFASDGQHIGPFDMAYSATRDKYYVLFRNDDADRLVISEVNPDTLARTDFVNVTDIKPGLGSITQDETNLYVCTFFDDPSEIVKIPFATAVPAAGVAISTFSQAHCLRYFTGKLFAVGRIPTRWIARIAPSNLAVEESLQTGDAESEFGVDDIGESTDHIYVGTRNATGVISKYSKTSFAGPVQIATGQLSKCTCAKRAGDFNWFIFENGKAVRFNYLTSEQRIYTLNAGQGYYSEIASVDNEFVHFYNLSTSKLARYHIPPDVVPGGLLWLREIDSKVSTSRVVVAQMKVDRDGSIVCVGEFTGTFDFGNGNVVSSTARSIFIAKYSADGAWLKFKQFGGSSVNLTNSGYGIAIDSLNRYIITGFYQSTINFGGSDLNDAGNGDMFLVKFDSELNHIWSIKKGDTGFDVGYSVAVDASDNIFVLGTFTGTVNFGVGEGGSPLTAAGSFDIFLAKFNSSGVHQWSKRFGGALRDNPKRLVVDAAGNPIIVGFFEGTANFGGADVTATNSFDIIIGKYSGVDGSLIWRKSFGSTGQYAGDDFGISVAVDRTVTPNRIVVLGNFSGTINFGGSDISATTVSQAYFLAKFESDGTHVDSRKYGGQSSSDIARDVAVDNAGNMLITGYARGVIDFGGGFRFSNGSTDIVIAKFDAAFVWKWDKRIGDVDDDTGRAITFDASGNVIVGGEFAYRADFGSGIVTTLQSARDGFLAKFAG